VRNHLCCTKLCSIINDLSNTSKRGTTGKHESKRARVRNSRGVRKSAGWNSDCSKQATMAHGALTVIDEL
jgi:hypothetical protein